MALALDGTVGTATKTGTGTWTIPITTPITAGDIVVCCIFTEAVNGTGSYPTVGGLSDTNSLSWARRAQIQMLGGTFTSWNNMELWWAYAPSTLGAGTTITVTPAGGTLDDACGQAFAVTGFTGGTYSTNPWDSNVSLPATASNSSSTNTTPTVNGISTTNAATMIMAFEGDAEGGGRSTGTIGGTTATILGSVINGGGTNNGRQIGQYVVETSPQSSITTVTGDTNAVPGWVMIADALAQTGGAAATPLTGSANLIMMRKAFVGWRKRREILRPAWVM